MQELSRTGSLVPDALILSIMKGRLDAGKAAGEKGFVLDGFPRTRAQAEELSKIVRIDKAVNLSLREEVLIEKCLGRRVCKECGKNYNVADIYLKAEGDRPEIVMPPLNPPEKCIEKMEIRQDDTEPVVLKRLAIYHAEAKPVEEFYSESGILVDFEITGGIPETLPRLQATLQT
mmetsp:Transcript_46116/g.147538  ORF Transcript_46116/g.147538 Transcript_46116/m.147538 type:complete len:175 (-) Transcript_46116:1535-2059(-)